MAGALLVAVLVSALRGRSWSWRRTIGFAGLCVIVATLGVYQTFPSAYDERPSTIQVRLPLDGPVTVAWGGATRDVNYHVGSPAERWAYDLLVTLDGSSHEGGGRAVSDYYAYNQPVRAPAAGRVVAIHDGEPDAEPGEPDRDRRGGNFVVIEVGPDQFLFLVHLKARSIRVQPGQQVRPGEVVARVGNSGNSTEPHVHLHLQDTAVPQAGQGIPFGFSSYITLPAGLHVARGIPTGGIRHGRFLGEVVESATDP
jgi:murein DD-endopeptidase MepM/ murein hydrolase activator NlpD